MDISGHIPSSEPAARACDPSGSAARIAIGNDFPVAARQLFGNVRLDFPDGEKDSRKLVSLPLGDCRLSQLQAGSHTVHGERVAIRSFDPDALKLIIQSQGQSVIEQNGTRSAIKGDAPVLYDPTRPYRLVNTTPVRLLMLQLPRERFAPSILQRLNTPLLPGQTALTPILLALMRSTMLEASSMSVTTRASVGSAITELVRALAAGEPEPEKRRPSIDLLLERIKDFIERNLSRPDLCVALIARRMGCSPRYVFRAFEQECATPADYLWGIRLEKARDRLQKEDEKARSISEIAFSLGFSSTAHFSRAFRERYDMTPRDFRRRT